MEVTTFAELIKSEYDFVDLLSELNIKTKNSYIFQEYRLISDLNKLVGDIDKIHEFRIKHSPNGEVELAVIDLFSIYNLLKYFNECEKSILKDKIENILKLTPLIEENNENNIARNILFEFSLYAYLRSVGMEAELKKINPDILVKSGGRKYFIQCKRLISQRKETIRSNIERALEQLHSNLRNEDENNFGVISLSLERFLIKDNNITNYKNEEVAILALKEKLRMIIDNYNNYWRNDSLNKDKRIVGILLHTTEPVRILNKLVLSTVGCLTLSNAGNSEAIEFEQFKEDFKKLQLIEK